ncbi:MAG TPA: ABC transporter substrate-binding protein [Chloroflexi bacterium]|nr:ABC transporter substrate-binding protein [Chloroflexota bacterium]HHW87143.1 extracellular solute-binding protein [Chloroflexota bacterium]
MTVRVALISGPMYDALYARLPEFTRLTGIAVELAFQGDHPALNEFLATEAAAACDLVSTHTKYAPSQQALLAPLDELLTPADLADFTPALLKLASIGERLYSLPRNVDVRLLHYRTDLVTHTPATWDELLDLMRRINRPPTCYAFVFPGMESGLFGTFYELVEMAGAELFPPDLTPQIENAGGRWALQFLRTCYTEGLVSPEIVGWHYDKVHDAFRAGRAALVGDWPGYYADYCAADSPVRNRFALARYPVGPSGKSLVYGGSHTFALTRCGAENADALALLRFLTAPEQQLVEARQGAVPVRASVMQIVQQGAAPTEQQRWQTLADAITSVVIPPKFSRYPLVEEVLWKTVQAAMIGALSIDDALHKMTIQIADIVAGEHAG